MNLYVTLRRIYQNFHPLKALVLLKHADILHVLEIIDFVAILAADKINNLKSVNLKQDK